MLICIENIEDILRSKFRKQVVDQGIKDAVKFLQQWLYLSSQVTRLHGAALARVQIPDIQYLLAEIAYGECGFGNKDKIHSKLLTNLINQSVFACFITQRLDSSVVHLFEETVIGLSNMSQDEAIGFIVGLEAPAYQILQLLKEALVGVGISDIDVLKSEYFVIHYDVEKEHQKSGSEAMDIIMDSGFELSKIYKGGDQAINFLIKMMGDA
ncbi:iron-containing redox enzyme family protein [Calothrix rhizosoleniae]|uniref:iron-containing redox enzyme family protein n=1 Tax=Calothrix rhizosoleniae TaxID=888997 RepID=UPI000B49E287|nr:iron-containing redox enzyme family protein [Calothrix rhizosoleniae]